MENENSTKFSENLHLFCRRLSENLFPLLTSLKIRRISYNNHVFAEKSEIFKF